MKEKIIFCPSVEKEKLLSKALKDLIERDETAREYTEVAEKIRLLQNKHRSTAQTLSTKEEQIFESLRKIRETEWKEKEKNV